MGSHTWPSLCLGERNLLVRDLQPTFYFFFFSHFSLPNTKNSLQSTLYFLVNPNGLPNIKSHLSSLNYLSTFFVLSLYIYVLLFLNYWKLVKIGCKIESVIEVNFKKLLAKIVNLIFKYILSS